MKPFVKWAGGKGQAFWNVLRHLTPRNYGRYYEPFLGGGAVLLSLCPSSAVVNDINAELVNLYVQIRTDVDGLLDRVRGLDDGHAAAGDRPGYYNEVRLRFNEGLNSNTCEQAARLLYINKHCYNGLYRVNSRGLFNVPFNHRDGGPSCSEENVRSVSLFLRGVSIRHGDFEAAVGDAEAGDFVFIDSPYAPLTPSSFTGYASEGFEYGDHVRLSRLFASLSDRGVYCMLTNSNTAFVHALYGRYRAMLVPAARSISADAATRTGEELVITNYDPA